MRRPPFRDLGSYLDALAGAGELARVRCEVDPEYEITQIVQEAMAKDGPALLFERVRGSPYPLAVNLFGRMSRIEAAFGRHPGEIGRGLARLADRLNPPSLKGLLSEWRSLLALRFMRTTRGRLAARPLAEPDFLSLPALKCWPGDAGRFLTFGLVVSVSPGTARRNVGIYRMQVLDARRVVMHWQVQKGGSMHEAESQGGRMPVAIAVGADPATMFAAACPLPEGMDELAFAGLLRGAATPLARGIEMDVPAGAEFLVEGWVDPGTRVPEGPFGDHYGHYSHPAPFPVFEAARMSAKRGAVYVASVVGKPPQEDRAIGDAIQEIFTPLIRLVHPELVDMWSYHEAGFHNLLVASVRQRYAREGMKTALGLLGQGQLSLTKCVILVDPAVNVRSFPEVLRAVRDNFDSREDLQVLPRTAPDTLDFTGLETNTGSKVIIDATSFPTAAGKPAAAAEPLAPPPAAGAGGWRGWENALLVVRGGAGASERDRAVLERLVADPGMRFPLVAMVSADVDLEDDRSVIWGVFTRFDAARDIVMAGSGIRGAWPRLAGPVGMDATFKRGYPAPVVMPEAVRGRVRTRWPEYLLPF